MVAYESSEGLHHEEASGTGAERACGSEKGRGSIKLTSIGAGDHPWQVRTVA